MKSLKYLIGIGVVLIVAFIVYNKAGSKKDLEVKVIAPDKGVVVSSISATGKIVSGQESEVVSSINSRVVKVLANEGQLVSRGELLIRLDDRDALTRINRDKAMLQEARVKVEQAERSLKALKNVYAVGGTSLNSVQDAELQYTVALTAKEKTAAELSSSSLYLEHFRIIAPFSGTIVKKNVHIGDEVATGVSLLSLADISKREIEVSVDEADAEHLQVGQQVEVSCEALPNIIWKEKILRIEHVIRKDGSANTLKTRVSFSKNTSKLRLGQQVDVKIKLAEKKGVYKVPFDAVINRDGKNFLATIREGKVHFEPVDTGIEYANSVEILTPVRPNEKFIRNEGKNLCEGDSVIPIPDQR